MSPGAFFSIRLLVLILLAMSCGLFADIYLPKGTLSLSQLSKARERAANERKPIAFIVTVPEYFEIDESKIDMFSAHPAGALIYALSALADRAVLVIVDAEKDKAKYPAVLKEGLFQNGVNFFTPPKVVMVDPALSRTISIIGMTSNIEERQQWFLEAIQKAEDPANLLPLPVRAPAASTLQTTRNYGLLPWEWVALGALSFGLIALITRR